MLKVCRIVIKLLDEEVNGEDTFAREYFYDEWEDEEEVISNVLTEISVPDTLVDAAQETDGAVFFVTVKTPGVTQGLNSLVAIWMDGTRI